MRREEEAAMPTTATSTTTTTFAVLNGEEKEGNGWSGEKEEERREEVGVEEMMMAADVYCGLGPCRPPCMQPCASINCAVTIFGIATLCSSTILTYINTQITTLEKQFGFSSSPCASINCAVTMFGIATLCSSTILTYINTQITTLEKQFGFSSSVSGILLSCNDFGFLLLTLFTSYLARRVHIPRMLSLFTCLFGLSGVICSIPFFIVRGDIPPLSETFRLSSNTSVSPSGRMNFERYMCKETNLSLLQLSAQGGNATGFPEREATACGGGKGSRAPTAVSADGQVMAITLIALGMILQGMAKSPRQTFVATYIDDNGPKSRTPLLVAVVGVMAFGSQILSYLLGGVFSRTYVTLESTSMSPKDPRWIGAWWLGFLAFGLIGILSSIPLLFFPRRFRIQPHLQQQENKRKRKKAGQKCLYDVKVFCRSLYNVLRRPVFVCAMTAMCLLIFGSAGMMSFSPKYLETQFMIPAWQANIIIGISLASSNCLGLLLGGYLTSRFKWTPRQCLKMVTIVILVSAVAMIGGYFLGCDQPDINMGVTSGSMKGNRNRNDVISESCHGTCRCNDRDFFPTCGADGVVYFSPCHAGCTENKGRTFRSCSCVNATLAMTSSWDPEVRAAPEARPGFCSSGCGGLYKFAGLIVVAAFGLTINLVPMLITVMRSVKDVDKPLGIGLYSLAITLIGFFLGPLMFGRLVDTCCLLWSSGCAGKGSCRLYDLWDLKFRLLSTFILSRVGAAIFASIAWRIEATKAARAVDIYEHDVMKQVMLLPEAPTERKQRDGKGEEHGTLDLEEDEDKGRGEVFKGNY